MGREKEGFRNNLERLDVAFPNQELLRGIDVARFLGIDPRTARTRYSIVKGYISKVKLASELS